MEMCVVDAKEERKTTHEHYVETNVSMDQKILSFFLCIFWIKLYCIVVSFTVHQAHINRLI